MSKELICLSPIDGTVYATREALSLEVAREQIAIMRHAQIKWAMRPLDERIALVLAGVENLGSMQEEMVLELAWMMGRPIRYGGEFGGVKERATYMAEIAKSALANVQAGEDETFKRFIKRDSSWSCFCYCSMELSVPDGDQHHCPGFNCWKFGCSEACDTDTAGW